MPGTLGEARVTRLGGPLVDRTPGHVQGDDVAAQHRRELGQHRSHLVPHTEAPA